MFVILFCTLVGAFVGCVVPTFLLWVGALIGFVIGLAVVLLSKSGGSSGGFDMPDFDIGD